MKKLVIALLCISYAMPNFAMDMEINAQYEKTKDTIDMMKDIVNRRQYVRRYHPEFKYLLLFIKLNEVLLTYIPYNFVSLPIDAEVMVFAAYQKNAKLMRFLVPRVQKFLDIPGIWDALAHLYFNQLPTVALIVQLKSMLMTA